MKMYCPGFFCGHDNEEDEQMKERPVVVQELDSIDYQIIDMLQKNARISAKVFDGCGGPD